MKQTIKRFLPLIMIVPLLVFCLIVALQPVREAKPKVIIRYDDYGVWCNQDWIQIEEEIIRLHEKYNVKLTYAVIPESRYPLVRHKLSPQSYPSVVDSMRANPYPLTEGSQRVNILKNSVKSGTIEVALHGYYHPKGYSNTEKNTEYYNIPYDVQYWKLKEGKHLLDSLFETNVTTLVPPHNTYDNLTLDLLQEFGFNCISAKPNSFDAPMDSRLDLRYLWYTTADCKVFGRVLRAQHYENEPTQILQLHHTNFTTDGIRDAQKIEDYENLLKLISDQQIPNYTFAGIPDSETHKNELYIKSLYQTLISKGQPALAEKISGLTSFCSVTKIKLLFLLCLMMAIGGSVYTLLNIAKIRVSKLITLIAISTSMLLLIWIASILLGAYDMSIYNLHYCLLTVKLVLLLCLCSVTASISTYCFLHKD